MKLTIYRNTSDVRWGHRTLPGVNQRTLHLFWLGPIFLLWS